MKTLVIYSRVLHLLKGLFALIVFFISTNVILAQSTTTTTTTIFNSTNSTNTTSNVPSVSNTTSPSNLTTTTNTSMANTTFTTTTTLLPSTTSSTTTMTTTTTTTFLTTTTTQIPSSSPAPEESPLFTPVDMLILPSTTTGAEVRDSTSLIHILLRHAHWAAPVGSYIALRPLHLNDGEMPVVNPQQIWPRQYWHYLDPNYNVSSPSPPLVTGLPFGWWDLTPQNADGTFTPGARWKSPISGNISTWAEPVNQEDEILDATVQTALTSGELRCHIEIVSVAEGLLFCNGTIFPAEDEQMMFVIPPFLLTSLDVNASHYKMDEPRNTPYTVLVYIVPEDDILQTIRRYITSILGLVALVSTIVGKEPHIHIMSLARMSLIGRVLECSDEVDLILHPTHVRLGRGIEKGRYFGALIFNTAIAMGLLIGHNVIARIFPRLLPDPPPSLQFVIAGALLPGITLAGLKTVTLQSSPVQFFLACVVLILFIGAWFGCYSVTARDKNFFHRYGRWQHKTDPFFMIRWRVFFTSYKAKRRFYVLVEIIITLLMAVPSGVTLSDYLDRTQSCWYRAWAMFGLVLLDTLLILLLRPYAIKIDTVVYAISKFFELAISAAAVARAGDLQYASEIGTIFWIAGALFIGVWQSYRAYDKAQYNSQQNEFFLTTADTADIAFNELGGDKDGRRHHPDDEDYDPDDENNNRNSNNNKPTTLQSLFPESDYIEGENDNLDNHSITKNNKVGGGFDDYDDDDENYSENEDLFFRPNSAPKIKQKKRTSSMMSSGGSARKRKDSTMSSSYNNPPPMERRLTQPPEENPSPWKGRLPPRNTKGSTDDPTKNSSNGNDDDDEEDDDLEMALLSNHAPRLQFSSRGDDSNNNAPLSIPPSVGTVSLPDDPLVEFWDALSDSSAYNKNHKNNLLRSGLSSRKRSSGLSYNGDDEDDNNNNNAEMALLYGNNTGDEENNNNNGNNNVTTTSTAQVHGSEGNVNYAPKLQLRDVANKRKIPEAQPCRFQESLEAPGDLNIDDDDDGDVPSSNLTSPSKNPTITLLSGSGPNAVRKTNSMKKLESGEYAAKFAELFGDDDMMKTPTSVDRQREKISRAQSLPPKFVDDEFKQRFGRSGTVAPDGVGIEL